MALALGILLPELEDQIAVHHGSVDRERRLQIEDGLKAGTWRAVVASSSLEMGVDFSSVDQVLLIGTPRGVSRALQRLGRSGHRVDGVAQGALVPLSLPDLVECVALREAARAGHLDALRIPSAPLDVLAQVLLGMSIEQEWSCDEAFDLVRRAGPYLDLSREDFDEVLRYLAGQGKVLGPYGTYGKIILENGRFHVAKGKTARNYYMNLGVISSDVEMKVVSGRNRMLGAVEESFITSLQPNEAFIMGGKAVRVNRFIKIPQWSNPRKERTSRPLAGWATRWHSLHSWPTKSCVYGANCGCMATGAAEACITMLKETYNVSANVASRIAQFLAHHTKALPVPDRLACLGRASHYRPQHVDSGARGRRTRRQPFPRLGFRSTHCRGPERGGQLRRPQLSSSRSTPA